MKPITEIHNGITVVRDDLFPGGSKARYFNNLFTTTDQLVYASSSCGGAQVALAAAAKANGKTAHLFVTQRAEEHPRTTTARKLGATIHTCANRLGGCVRLNVVISRAQKFADAHGIQRLELGGNSQAMLETLAEAARTLGDNWDQVWCPAGSGTLSRALQLAFPQAAHHMVMVGQPLNQAAIGNATAHLYPKLKLYEPVRATAPFPSCAHYDRKAWLYCEQQTAKAVHEGARVLFWNVLGD